MSERTVGDLVAALSAIAPFEAAASWDPVGLQFGDAADVVDSIAVCHEVTNGVVRRLEEAPVDLLVAYHPLLFEPPTRLVAGRSSSGRAFRLIRRGVALAVVHTAYDVAPGGAADALAATLGLRDVAGFGPLWGADTARVIASVPPGSVDLVTAAMANAGARSIAVGAASSFRISRQGSHEIIRGGLARGAGLDRPQNDPDVRVEMITPVSRVDGVVGALVSAHPGEDAIFEVVETRADAGFVGRVGVLAEPAPIGAVADLVARRLGGVLRWSRGSAQDVQTVGVVPGSGGSFTVAAAAAGADVLVTGDVSHHVAREAIDLGLAVIDPGHAATERPGVATLYAAVSAMGPTTDLTMLAASPWEEPE